MLFNIAALSFLLTINCYSIKIARLIYKYVESFGKLYGIFLPFILISLI